MDLFLLAQGIGVIALIANIISYQSKTRDQILSRQMVGSLLFMAHFALLSAWTGAAMHAIVVVRNWIFGQKEKYVWAGHIIWLFVFFALSLGFLYFSWEGLISIFPAIAVLTGVYARWQEHPKHIRIWGLVGVLMWLPYTLIVESYPGTVTQLFIAGAIIYGMVKHDREVKNEG